MPTMTSRRLSDLEAERDSFILHERNIILERDEALKNVREHLDRLDVMIVRLGGTARRIDAPSPSSDGEAGVSDPPIEGGSEPGGKETSPKASTRSGRARGGSGGRGEGTDNAAPSAQGEEEEAAVGAEEEGKENERAKSSNANDDDKPSSSTKPAKGRKKRGARKGDDSSQATASGSVVPATDGEAWTCECGEEIPAGRARCGKCRKWKGGKRQKRWSLKGGGGEGGAASGEAKPDGRKKRKRKADDGGGGASRAIEVYRSLQPPAEDKKSEQEDIAEVLMSMSRAGDAGAGIGGSSRAEVESIVTRMVDSVSVADDGTASRAGGKGKKRAKVAGGGGSRAKKKKGEDGPDGGDAATKEAQPKRKRGRPKKNPGAAAAAAVKKDDEGAIQGAASKSSDAPESGDGVSAKAARGADLCSLFSPLGCLTNHGASDDAKAGIVLEMGAKHPPKTAAAAAAGLEAKNAPKQPPALLGGVAATNEAAEANETHSRTVDAAFESDATASRAAEATLLPGTEARGAASSSDGERLRVTQDIMRYFNRLGFTQRVYSDLFAAVSDYASGKVDAAGLVCRARVLLAGRDDVMSAVGKFLRRNEKAELSAEMS